MNKKLGEGMQLAEEIVEGLNSLNLSDDCSMILAPPFIHLSGTQSIIADQPIQLGSQNNSQHAEGAYTGEVSAAMLKSVGVRYGIVGHSERRAQFGESNEELLAKSLALLENDIDVIFCCGEQLEERENGQHFKEIEQQLSALWSLSPEQFSHVMIAYEPVWAIGTGVTASPEQAQEMHAFIRQLIEQNYSAELAEATSILYGGSVKAANAQALFDNADVDGGLIGGASLQAQEFLAIAKALSA